MSQLAFATPAVVAPISTRSNTIQAFTPPSHARVSGWLADHRPIGTSRLISPVVVAGTLRLAELLLIAIAGLAIARLYLPAGEFAVSRLDYALAALLAGAATVIVFQVCGLYDVPSLRSAWRQSGRAILGWTLVVAGLAVLAFLTKAGATYSRMWLIVWYLAGGALLVTGRVALSLLLRSWSQQGRLNRRAVIVGGGPQAAELIAALESDPDNDIRICGIFDDRDEARIGAEHGYRKLGKIDELISFAQRTRIDLLIVALPLCAEDRLLQVLKKLWVLPVDVRLAAQASRLQFRPRAYSYIGGVPFLDMFDKPIADWDYVVKSAFDKTIGLLALVLLAPVMALVALAIRLDSKGPVLFRQKRYGFNNELIEVYKFRSMYTEASDAGAARLVSRHDPRVTRVGRIIRKSSLDELPQLFNVLKGELSLVGPRPHAVLAKADNALYADVVDGYFARHKVKPGITGWAQVNGWRGETDTREKIEKRVEHDLYYIENWSVLFDLIVLIRTPFALLKSENAY